MALLARNNATSTLSATLTNVATSLSLQSGHGVRFPNPTGGDYFYVAIIAVGKYEVVKVTARSTDSLTIVRAQDNTTADSFDSGDAVKLLVTAVYITDTWTELGLKATIASPTFTGTPAAPTASVDTNTTQLATTAYVMGQGYAKLASPTFTGVPLVPTAAVDTNTTQAASTAYVVGQGYLKSATASSTYQPLDADLTSIAGLGYASTSFLKKTAANTWTLDTATYEPSFAAGTTAQYYRGDKTWQTLNATAVGLGNVANTAQVTSVGGTAPVVSSGGTTPTISMAAATSSNHGYMTSTFADKLDLIGSGTYTPTQANAANCSVTLYTANYSRNGGMVTVSGRCDINVTTGNTVATVDITLPVLNAAFTAYEQAAGTCAQSGETSDFSGSGSILACLTGGYTSYVTITYFSSQSGVQAVAFMFMYRVG
jgi:hypothetical protein